MAHQVIYKKIGFDKDAIIEDGHRFLLGNGRLGYRGTLEEYTSENKVAVTIAGVYDQLGAKWREPLNAPNPFFVRVHFNDKPCFLPERKPLLHITSLNLRQGLFERKTEYPELTITSKRFAARDNVNRLVCRYRICIKDAGRLHLEQGLDTKVWDINGPHLTIDRIIKDKYSICYIGKSNEGLYLIERVAVSCNLKIEPSNLRLNNIYGYVYDLNVSPETIITFTITSEVLIAKNESEMHGILTSYSSYKQDSWQKMFRVNKAIWNDIWSVADVKITGNQKADFYLRYSIYHLLILAPTKYLTSISARGLSGQTYKGAVFWDTEIFMLPVFRYILPEVGKKLVQYRINTLIGAQRKAQRFGHVGAYYAWESQDTGDEACSLYNLTDAMTGEPVRTYFADKQIHINGDVAKAIIEHDSYFPEDDIFANGGFVTLLEIAKFYVGYATYDKSTDLYHLNDVLGPDEYHERVDDNAFTNYLVKFVLDNTLSIANEILQKHPTIYQEAVQTMGTKLFTKIEEVARKLFLPVPNKLGVIEQFKGYFDLEDVGVATVSTRLKSKNEYWGGKQGIATPTRVIKQADVIALLALFPDQFSNKIKQANFDFYEKYTEHGSSLSACMHGLVACKIGRIDKAYEYFIKSASIDLVGASKQFAGSIYIGGTHPASNGGAYQVALFGFAGLHLTKDGPRTKANMPPSIKSISFKYWWRGRLIDKKLVNPNYKKGYKHD